MQSSIRDAQWGGIKPYAENDKLQEWDDALWTQRYTEDPFGWKDNMEKEGVKGE